MNLNKLKKQIQEKIKLQILKEFGEKKDKQN